MILGIDFGRMYLVDRWEFPRWVAGNEVGAILALALGTLVVIRTNAAYKRWWEARTLWGQLINEIRNLALKTRAYITRYFAGLIGKPLNRWNRTARFMNSLCILDPHARALLDVCGDCERILRRL